MIEIDDWRPIPDEKLVSFLVRAGIRHYDGSFHLVVPLLLRAAMRIALMADQLDRLRSGSDGFVFTKEIAGELAGDAWERETEYAQAHPVQRAEGDALSLGRGN